MHVVGGVGWPVGLLREDPPGFAAAPELAANVGAGASSYTDYDREITEAACDWLFARRESETPWVTMVSLVSPHYPLVAPPKFHDLYDPESVDFPIAYEHAQRPGHAELKNIARFFDYDRTSITEGCARPRSHIMASFPLSTTALDASSLRWTGPGRRTTRRSSTYPIMAT